MRRQFIQDFRVRRQAVSQWLRSLQENKYGIGASPSRVIGSRSSRKMVDTSLADLRGIHGSGSRRSIPYSIHLLLARVHGLLYVDTPIQSGYSFCADDEILPTTRHFSIMN
ncbi:hypothetical protein N7489_010698 [Penicillium chrysogenum]|uniref:Uncharacterized protein n=1 Tax=Penicillium chrysogenum TaxID=5076 RepID=A0ABQ8WT71_PENCH|nr:uncharacterized protein N7489_010698 [Penicillium chrysogenum]KAJ5229990.1 hypothetical protein N7489_010698 [Penicillium chrysogenum]KAJ5282116.1 hypothetical protein N7505_000096 [Penicillium chrysogenum]KAJ6141036.1 hypothetical protein N7497_011929 [Penicillium chrysogenum]